MSDVLNRRRKTIYSAQKVNQNQAANTFSRDEQHVIVKDWMHEHGYGNAVVARGASIARCEPNCERMQGTCEQGLISEKIQQSMCVGIMHGMLIDAIEPGTTHNSGKTRMPEC